MEQDTQPQRDTKLSIVWDESQVRLTIAKMGKRPFPQRDSRHASLTFSISWLDLQATPSIAALPACPQNYDCMITDPAVLYLVQWLQTEQQIPKAMSQVVISSIVTVLTMHLLQQWQTEYYPMRSIL